MKLKISDPDLVRLLKDRIDDFDADGLCYVAGEILGLTQTVGEYVEYDIDEDVYIITIKEEPECYGFTGSFEKDYDIKVEN